jgi:diguanylate cyclase (GGDEF)-like protein
VRIDGTFLRSAVGRRIFFLFLFASTIPIALLALVTWHGVSDLLNRQARAELSAYSKTYGMEVAARVQSAQAALERFAVDNPPPASGGGASRTGDGPMFRALVLAGGDGSPVAWPAGGDVPAQVLAELAAKAARGASLPGDEALVVVPGGAPADTVLAMVRHIQPKGSAERLVVGVVDPSYVFGNGEDLAARVDACVFAGPVPLYCSNWRLLAQAQRAAARQLPGDVGAEAVDLGSWTLLPTTQLKFEPMTFISMRAVESGALADRGIGATYVKVALACVVGVALLSLVQIRRILVPLERLMDATRRLAVRDFSQPIPIEGRDEFGRLAESFNAMARILDSQIGDLKTLSSIDQDILSNVDVDRIIDRVLHRVHQLAPGAVAGVARIAARSDPAAQIPLWRIRGDGVERIGVLLGERERARLAAGGMAARLDDREAADSALARALATSDAAGPSGSCLLIPSRTLAGACTLIALCPADGAAWDAAAIDQVRELGNRIGVAFDAAEWQRKLLEDARSDSLTGLPNRLRIHEIIETRLAGAGAGGTADPFAVLFIDLDRFKGVNDGLGHDAGDALLVQAAGRIRNCLRAGDVVARLGGDEFIVLTGRIAPAEEPSRLAADLIRALTVPYRIGLSEVHVGASIGIALGPADGATRDALIRNADTAMYRAKAQGRGRAVKFQESMSRAAVEVLSLEKDLRSALERSEIEVHFQPRVRLSDGSLVGAEALARWCHATRGAVPPDQFIPMAEEIGLIEALGEDVLGKTCDLLTSRGRDGQLTCPISVNLSALQLRNPEVVQRLTRIIEAFGVDPGALELEITESALVDDMAASCAALQRLRDAGFRIALDDFGTGYSSMSYLQNLPIDVMKIDRSFVADIVDSPGSRAIAVAIIGMARTLGLRVVAEGVETQEQATLLRQWGCEEAQGYFFSPPLPPDRFEAYLSAHLGDAVCVV